jgi:hypothetical protein
MSQKTITLKRGSTLSLSGSVKLPTGTWTATAKIAKPNNVILDTLGVTLTPLVEVGANGETHSISVTRAASFTETWQLGNLQCDIRFEDSVGGTVIHTPTFFVNVVQEITDAS